MSRIVQSPFPEWPGSITLPDGLTMIQTAQWEAVAEISRLRVEKAQTWVMALPVVAGIIESWNIEGIPEHPTINNHRFAPYKTYRKFSAWVIGLISELYLGETEYPKVSEPQLGDGSTAANVP